MSFEKQYLEDIASASASIQKRIGDINPQIAIVLWSWLWDLEKEIEPADKLEIAYDDIPWFPPFRAVQWHAGKLIIGKMAWKDVLMMSGRYHYYEYADMLPTVAMKTITLPIRVFQSLGIKNLIISNAAWGVNKDFAVWDIMLIKDHINHMGSNPLLWPNIPQLGERFVPMTDAYDPQLRELAKQVATDHNITLHEWVYMALTGPTFETGAEYDWVKFQWADVVWMSTVPEVIAARHVPTQEQLINILWLTVVTNIWWSHIQDKPSHEEVQQAAHKAMPTMIKVVAWVVEKMK